MEFLIPITLIFALLYEWRFNIFNIPTNFLMLWVFFVWIVFFSYLTYKKQILNFFLYTKTINKKVLLFTVLFFLSGIFSLFTNGIDLKKIGQFLILFVQPITLFFICNYTFSIKPKTKDLLLTTCYLLLGLMGTYAIVQYFTLWGLPQQFWGNNVEPKRAVSFFSHPNFYALFSAPLLAFLIPDIFIPLKTIAYKLKASLWVFGTIGLFLSLSRAGWLGLACAVSVYLIFVADKKIRKFAFVIVIVMVIALFSIPNFRYRLLLPFYGERSANSRMELWASGWKAIKTSPVFGLGLNGYLENYQKFQTNKTLDTHNFPHNIFLNFWVETGLLGLISFISIVILGIYKAFKKTGVILNPIASGDEESQRQRSFAKPQSLSRDSRGNDAIRLGMALFLTCLLTQGLIDNPYFKNDLAMAFWVILSLIV